MVVVFFVWSLLFSNFSYAQCGVKVKGAHQKDFDRSLALYHRGNLREASQLMRRVAQRNPKAAEPQFWLGMYAVANGYNAVGIRRYFGRCLELCPSYPDARAHYYQGVIFYTDRHYDEAVTAFDTYFSLANATDDSSQLVVYNDASAYLHWSRFLADAELQRVPFDPEVLKGVSGRRDENLPYITPDGRRCYYLRQVAERRNPASVYTPDVERTSWRLFYSDWVDGDSTFGPGKELPPPFNQGAPEGSITATADGSTLFFSRIVTEGGYANSDIYTARCDASGRWTIEPLGGNVNGSRTWESQPSVSSDGRWLYFASNRKGGMGGTDIWRCHRLPNGDWSRAENLGSSVNTVGNERFPFLHADGRSLYFVSDGWQGFGGYDFYFITLGEGADAVPTNMGLPINSEDDELCLGVTPDGRRAYFPGRLETSRSRDILIFDLYPAARPVAMQCCRTRVGERDTAFMLPLRGRSVLSVARPGALPLVAMVQARDFSAGGRYHDAMPLPLPTDSVVSLAVTMLPGSRLTDDDERLLDAWAAWLIDHPRVQVEIGCPKVTDAKAIYRYLVDHKKLRAERISYQGGTAFTHPQIRLLCNL